jgi:hypothetical protein
LSSMCLDDGGSNFLWNRGALLRDDVASFTRTPLFSSLLSSPSQLQILL